VETASKTCHRLSQAVAAGHLHLLVLVRSAVSGLCGQVCLFSLHSPEQRCLLNRPGAAVGQDEAQCCCAEDESGGPQDDAPD
jgi:hypothetical protein